MKTKITLSLFSFVLIILFVVACKKNVSDATTDENYSAVPVLPTTPDNYRASSNDHLAALGRVLFYDRNLSLNNSVSCGSCHQQGRAFCDNLQFSAGLENAKTPRNSPSLFAKSGRVFWDGRATSMQDLALRPIKNHVEMKFENLEALSKKISKLSYYSALFNKAFPSNRGIDSSMIQKALAEFLKNFDFSDNKFNQSETGLATLNASEKLGKIVFFNKGKCSNCHHIEANRNIFPGDTMGSAGGYGSTDESHNIGLDEIYADNGVGVTFNDPEANGAFMVPALLNVEFTAPYMHDGRFKTLEEVVEHYNSGIKNHPNLDIVLRGIDLNLSSEELIKLIDKNHDGQIDPLEVKSLPPVKLGLTLVEKKGLVDFLKTLTDPTILRDQKFSNPFTLK